MKICCNSKTEIHTADCLTNYEFDLYSCIRCGESAIRYLMSLGLCQKCQGACMKVGSPGANYILTNDGRLRWHHDLKPKKQDIKFWVWFEHEKGPYHILDISSETIEDAEEYWRDDPFFIGVYPEGKGPPKAKES